MSDNKERSGLGQKVKIKNIELQNNVILAPMAGYTDKAFRYLCKSYGAGLTCTEMVSSMALHYKNKKTEELLEFFPEEHPISVQIFGHSPEIMAEAVMNPLLSKFDIIDINMGCPARKVVSAGDGSALLKDFDLAEKIIRACVNATDKPVTVKFRIGFEENEEIASKFAVVCENAGASAISIHGRTTAQGYSGVADYVAIKNAVKAVKIPVFANGDIKTKEDAERVLKMTNASGIMIGRAALGFPQVFEEILTGKTNVSFEKTLEEIKWHYEKMAESLGETRAVKYMRSHLAFYLSRSHKNKKALLELLKFDKMSEIFAKLDEIF